MSRDPKLQYNTLWSARTTHFLSSAEHGHFHIIIQLAIHLATGRDNWSPCKVTLRHLQKMLLRSVGGRQIESAHWAQWTCICLIKLGTARRTPLGLGNRSRSLAFSSTHNSNGSKTINACNVDTKRRPNSALGTQTLWALLKCADLVAMVDFREVGPEDHAGYASHP